MLYCARILFALWSVVAFVASASQLWSPASFPNPNTSPSTCGRNGTSRSSICDPDAVLSSSGKDVTEGILNMILEGATPYAKSPCAPGEGFQVAVAVMNAMQVPAGTTPSDAASSFARSLHNSWGVGHGPSCNDGALFLLSIQDRQMFVSTGDVSGVRLSDQTCDNIFEQLKPLLRDGAYDAAVQKAAVLIGQGLAVNQDVSRSSSPGINFDWLILPGSIFGLVAVIFCNYRLAVFKRRDFKTCTQRLEEVKRLSNVLQQADVQSYNPQTCPICFEDFDANSPSEMTSLEKEMPGPSAPPFEEASDKDPLLGSTPPLSPPTVAQHTPPIIINEKSNKLPSRKPLILPCQHQFCTPCMEAWMKQSKTSCPICRSPMNGKHHAPPPPPPDSGAGDPYYYQNHYHLHPYFEWRRAKHREELVYRMQQLRQRYPSYVTESMAQRARDDINEGRLVDPSVFTDLQLNDPATRKALASSGSSGSSISFGGGSSSGGRGSSW